MLKQLLWQAARAQGALSFSPEAPTLPGTVVGVPVVERSVTIEPGAANSRTLVLMREVGPALAPFGVDGPLRAPQLRVLDASGAAVAPANIPFALPTVAAATERVGAFALPASSAMSRCFIISRPELSRRTCRPPTPAPARCCSKSMKCRWSEGAASGAEMSAPGATRFPAADAI